MGSLGRETGGQAGAGVVGWFVRLASCGVGTCAIAVTSRLRRGLPRGLGEPGTVTGTVPSGYAAYARICHPAEDRNGRLVTWAEVAQATGRQAHPLMQWHAVVGSPDSLNMKGSLWPGDNPERGNLVPEVLGPLCGLLADHTATADQCSFCLWEGWGWIHGTPASAVFSSRLETALPEESDRSGG